jgi:glycosyltransferase involved in cell wall biosynthesis
MNVLMLVQSNVAHDARVLREARSLAAEGHVIHIIGKDVPQGWEPPTGVTVESVSGGSGLKAKPSGAGTSSSPRGGVVGQARDAARWALLPQHRQTVWRTWREHARELVGDRKYDVVHAHDFNVLVLAAELAEKGNAQLVYDSHEWWSGRERHGRPTPLERARELKIEREIVAKADSVLTVSEGIAERLGAWRSTPVAVVRNSFPLDEGSTAGELGERPKGVVYAGRIGAARDIDTLLVAAAALKLETLLMGNADPEFLSHLHLNDTVRVESARPVDEVDQVLREVGVSLVTLTDSCENHRLALPNKVFHAVRAGVPVVAADLPELRRIVTKYGLGALYKPGDAVSMQHALEQVTADYPALCANVARARGELNWDQDSKELIRVYAELAAAR